jgi:hypothetical protein
MHIDGGPMLVLHPENARDLMLAQGDGTRASAGADAVSVPARLQWRASKVRWPHVGPRADSLAM